VCAYEAIVVTEIPAAYTRLDLRRVRAPADELLLRVVPLVRPGAAGCIRDARLPDAGVHAADGVRGLREDAEAKNRPEDFGPFTACARRLGMSYSKRCSTASKRDSSARISLQPSACDRFSGVVRPLLLRYE
jgi:hypothetical protein